jgi:Tol biopolymer transport system component
MKAEMLRPVVAALLLVSGSQVGVAKAQEAPPENGKIAYVHVVSEKEQQIRAVTPDGRFTDVITSGYRDSSPSWAPDGHRLAYERFTRVHIRDFGGDRFLQTCSYDFSPAISPNFDAIATVRRYGKIGQLVLLDPSSGQEERVVRSGMVEVHSSVSWSPDGEQLVYVDGFATSSGTLTSAIWVVNRDGSGARALTDSGYADFSPAWSPDGARIAFTSTRDGATEIYVMGADGSDPVRLTQHRDHDSQPAWSPDGTKLAFVSHRSGSPDIWSMDADGSNLAQLTNDPAVQHMPSWGRVSTGPAPGAPWTPYEPPGRKDCYRYYDRNISLRIDQQNFASGAVTVTSGDGGLRGNCRFSRVKIERRIAKGRWRTVARVTTETDSGGRYRLKVSDRPGRYRARVLRRAIAYYHEPVTHICRRAVSGPVIRT